MLLVIVLAIIYVFATQTSRTHIFSAFWITHKLSYVFYILVLLHGSSRILQVGDVIGIPSFSYYGPFSLLQSPMFWCYFIGPAAIFVVDKTVTLARQKREVSVIDAELLPSGRHCEQELVFVLMI